MRQTVLTHADFAAHDTFDAPAKLAPNEPRVLSLSGSSYEYELAGQSVTRLEMSLV